MTARTMLATTTTDSTPRRKVWVGLSRPHSPGQRELVYSPDSIVVLAGGRYGKTEAAVRRIVKAMVERPGLYFWVGLSWQSASLKKAWRMVYRHWYDALESAGLDPRLWINRSAHEIRTPHGALLMFRTAENPESVAGDGPLGIVGDEFTYWDEEVWTRFIQPSTADHDAWVMLIGRPAGENWGSALWRDAAQRPGWIARHYTIHDNPLISRAKIADLEANTPPSVWAQEYMAEIGTGDDGVIPLAWIRAAMERWKAWRAAGSPEPDGPAFLAIDVSEGGDGDRTIAADRKGWTVRRVADWTPRDRGDMLPIGDRALREAEGATIVVDAVGVGAMLPAYIRRNGAKCVAFKGSEATKLRDGSGQFGFNNTASAAWWNMRELLDPATGPGVMLPDDHKLAAQLSGRGYKILAGARIAIDSKRGNGGGSSPDAADAVVMAFFTRNIMSGRILG